MTGMQLKIEAATHNALAEESSGTGLLQGLFEALIGLEDLTVDVVVTHADAHGEGRDGHALNHRMGVELHDVAVFARTGLALV